jgi:hypothetical protein
MLYGKDIQYYVDPFERELHLEDAVIFSSFISVL